MAAMMLGDLGADVIKIEHRVTGDAFRGYVVADDGTDVTIGGGRGCFYECINRNKRGIALDLGKTEGRELVYRLVRTADVFVQNFRKPVREKLQLDYATLSSYNPQLIYANCSGYGPEGSSSDDPAYDYLGLARSGIMHTTAGEPGMPIPVGAGLADQMGGTMAAYGILAALLARERLGVGQELDVSLLSSMMWLQYLNVSSAAMVGYEFHWPPRGQGVRNPLIGHYMCGDGRWIAISMLQADRHWADFCAVLGIEELREDPRFKDMFVRARNCAALMETLDRIFAGRTREDWIRLFREANLVVAPVNTIHELIEDEQVVANRYIVEYDHPVVAKKIKMMGVPVDLAQTPGGIHRPAPDFGQHTEEVLLEIGYSWDDIADLKEKEVI